MSYFGNFEHICLPWMLHEEDSGWANMEFRAYLVPLVKSHFHITSQTYDFRHSGHRHCTHVAHMNYPFNSHSPPSAHTVHSQPPFLAIRCLPGLTSWCHLHFLGRAFLCVSLSCKCRNSLIFVWSNIYLYSSGPGQHPQLPYLPKFSLENRAFGIFTGIF